MPSNVTLSISDGTLINNVPYTQGMTARNVLEAAYDMSVNPPTMPQITFWIDYYGYANQAYLGYIASMINGTTAMGNRYWFLYINNTLVNTGIDESVVNSGDQVMFKYEDYDPGIHSGTIIHKIKQASA
ncbi:MAG: DUF4430 domain-containing protein [Bacteroidota bacterium]